MAVRIKHVGRYREIAMALVRHGFGYMVEEPGIVPVAGSAQTVDVA